MAFTGIVTRLPIGFFGLSGSRNPTQLRAEHFEYVEGATLDGGLIQKDGGASKLNATELGGGAMILSGINYSPLADITREAVFLDTGDVLKDAGLGTFPTTLATGLVPVSEPPPQFCMGGGESVGSPRTLFLFSATNQVRAVDGDGNAMAAVTTPPADWAGAGNFPTFGILHEGRIFGGGNASDPHRVYYSQASDHQNFTGAGAGTLSIYPGQGERLVGGISFKGLLVLFKYPRGVYLVTTTDPSPTGWRVDELSSAVGGINQHTIFHIDNDVLFMDHGGNINILSATNAFGGMNASNISQISDISEFMRSNVNLTRIRRAVGLWYGVKQQAWFAIPGSSGDDNTIRLILDKSNPQVPVRFLTSRRDHPISMWLRPDDAVYKPVHGDDTGFVWIMDTDARNKDGQAYTVNFRSANMDLAFVDEKLATVHKTGDFLELIFEPQGDWDLTVQVFWDDTPMPPLVYSMGGSGVPIGSFTLDVDILASTAIRSIRKKIAGSGRRLRLEVTNDGEDQNIAISDFYLSFHTSGERNSGNAE